MKKELKSVTICGRKFKLDVYCPDIYLTLVNTFKTKAQVHSWYDKVLKSDGVLNTNFGGSPFEQHSFIVLKKDGATFVINPPKAKNGDNNWNSYGENFGFLTRITLKED